jgi:hypothetical protein
MERVDAGWWFYFISSLFLHILGELFTVSFGYVTFSCPYTGDFEKLSDAYKMH